MSAIYYRRWTRMFIPPAIKYFKQYDAILPGMEHLKHLQNKQDPYPENKWYIKKTVIDREQEINAKLIKNLFLKYPDLKYESISRQKYQGDEYNGYSYSYAFITQQKKLMKAGYNMRKAFEIVEEKFQDKMKRKLDQTLVSRGLAIGNRARSLLTVYQQQVQEQSKLKMLRTKRQVKKYEQKLQEIQLALNKDISENQEGQHYERIFQKITNLSNQELNQEANKQKRLEMIDRINSNFKNMFTQFYEIAAYRDKLQGLTDDEIKQQIRTSPSKIKKLSRELVKYLKSKGNVSIDANGELKMSDNINQNLRSFIYSSPTIKVAILNHLLGYESPAHSIRKSMEQQAKAHLSEIRNIKVIQPSLDVKKIIKENKIKEMQQVIEKNMPEDNNRTYRLLESAEERMLRLEIKYLTSFLKSEDNSEQKVFDRLKTAIEQFRRLKFRLQKRHKNVMSGELVFPEHFMFENTPSEIEDINIEYEDLLEYLRKKTEDRRLRAIDQVDDNKINERIQKQAAHELPKSEGEDHTRN